MYIKLVKKLAPSYGSLTPFQSTPIVILNPETSLEDGYKLFSSPISLADLDSVGSFDVLSLISDRYKRRRVFKNMFSLKSLRNKRVRSFTESLQWFYRGFTKKNKRFLVVSLSHNSKRGSFIISNRSGYTVTKNYSAPIGVPMKEPVTDVLVGSLVDHLVDSGCSRTILERHMGPDWFYYNFFFTALRRKIRVRSGRILIKEAHNGPRGRRPIRK